MFTRTRCIFSEEGIIIIQSKAPTSSGVSILKLFIGNYVRQREIDQANKLQKLPLYNVIEERTTYCSAVYNDRLYIFGGYSDSKKATVSQCCVLSFENMQWQPLETRGANLIPRFGAFCAVIDDTIYFIGGSHRSSVSRQSEIQSYNFSEKIVKDEESEGEYLSVKFGTCVAWENRLVLWGGMMNFKKEAVSQITYLELSNSDAHSSIENQTIPATESLISLVRQFLTEAPNHDIMFEVESELIPAHKWWLIKKSKYFTNMFSSGMVEEKSSKIVISDFKAATFKAFLEFLYTDSIDLDESLALELFQQADKYSVPTLKTLCEQYLSIHITPENYVKVCSLTEVLDSRTLREAAVAYIAKNVRILKCREDFAEISDDMLRDVIIKINVR